MSNIKCQRQLSIVPSSNVNFLKCNDVVTPPKTLSLFGCCMHNDLRSIEVLQNKFNTFFRIFSYFTNQLLMPSAISF